MESNINYKIAMSEVLYYLNGIKKEDVEKIPKKLIDFFNENSFKEYECQFDYTRPLKELNLSKESKGLIAMICLNYWCETKEQKNIFINKLNQNELKYQEELRKKYNQNSLFKNVSTKKIKDENKQETALVEYKENIFIKLKNCILKIFK